MNKLIEQVLALNADNIHIDANHKLLKNPESRAHFIFVLTKLQTSVATAFEQSVKHELVDDGIHNLQLFKEIKDVETRCKKYFDVGNIRYNRCIKKYTLKKKRAESVQSLVVEAYSLYTQFYGLWNDQIDLMSKYSIVNKDQLAECVSILHECIAKYTEIVSLIPQGRIASALASGSDYESLNIVKRHLVSKTAFNRAKFAQIANVKLTELNHLLEIIQKIIATTNNPTTNNVTTNNPTIETIDYTGATPFEQLLHSNEPVACLPVAVHDGDTMYVNVLFPLGETDPTKKFPVTLTLRLLGYDCARLCPKVPRDPRRTNFKKRYWEHLGNGHLFIKLDLSSIQTFAKTRWFM